ncbi:MAG TPA: ABC transporter ATP-binding protein, partial [Actinomycetota bacterium]
MIPITVRSLSAAYDGAQVVHELSFEVPTGTWLTMIGPNGAGKTTVLRAMAGLVDFSGDITIGGDRVAALPRRKLARLVAYVPQRPLIPAGSTVTDYVLMGRNPYIRYLASESRTDLDAVAGVLERLDLGEFAGREVARLSGGEIQRAVLARALAQEAPVLLLDEPTSALDVGHQQQVLELVDRLRREEGLTVVSTMHDLTLAGQYSEEFLLLDGGRAVARGPAPDVLREDLIARHYGATVEIVP